MIKDIREFWDKYPNFLQFLHFEAGTRDFFKEHDNLIEYLHPEMDNLLDYPGCKGKRVLDIGCGMGREAYKISQFAEEVYALDLSFNSIKISKRRFDFFKDNGNFCLLQANAETLPFKNEVFDRVYANGVIHHAPDTQKTANEIYRVLKSGGDAVIQVSHRHSFFYLYNVLLNIRFKYSLVKLWPKSWVKMLSVFEPDIMEIKSIVDKERWQNMRDLALRVTDGRDNPAPGKVYSKKEAGNLFNKFSDIRFVVRGRKDNFMDCIKFLERRIGFYLYIYLKK